MMKSIVIYLSSKKYSEAADCFIIFVIRSFSKDSDSSGLKPSPSSVLEFVEDVQTTLHHLVSEGDTEGVRLGQSLYSRHACVRTVAKHSYICSYMHPSIHTCTDKNIQSIFVCIGILGSLWKSLHSCYVSKDVDESEDIL